MKEKTGHLLVQKDDFCLKMAISKTFLIFAI